MHVWTAGKWRHYGQVDGLVWDDCNSRAFFADADGTVWIGTSRGLSRFHPHANTPASPPTVVVTDARLGETQLNPNAIVAANVPYSDRYLVVHFTAPAVFSSRERRLSLPAQRDRHALDRRNTKPGPLRQSRAGRVLV